MRYEIRLKEKSDEAGLLEMALSRTNQELEQHVSERNRLFREKVTKSRADSLIELKNIGKDKEALKTMNNGHSHDQSKVAVPVRKSPGVLIRLDL